MLTNLSTEVKGNECCSGRLGDSKHRADFNHREGRGAGDGVLPRRVGLAAVVHGAEHGVFLLRGSAVDAGDGVIAGVRSSEFDFLFPRAGHSGGIPAAGAARRGDCCATATDRADADARFVDDRVQGQRRKHSPVDERSTACGTAVRASLVRQRPYTSPVYFSAMADAKNENEQPIVFDLANEPVTPTPLFV
jgi:hypothetical protein